MERRKSLLSDISCCGSIDAFVIPGADRFIAEPSCVVKRGGRKNKRQSVLVESSLEALSIESGKIKATLDWRSPALWEIAAKHGGIGSVY